LAGAEDQFRKIRTERVRRMWN